MRELLILRFHSFEEPGLDDLVRWEETNQGKNVKLSTVTSLVRLKLIFYYSHFNLNRIPLWPTTFLIEVMVSTLILYGKELAI